MRRPNPLALPQPRASMATSLNPSPNPSPNHVPIPDPSPNCQLPEHAFRTLTLTLTLIVSVSSPSTGFFSSLSGLSTVAHRHLVHLSIFKGSVVTGSTNMPILCCCDLPPTQVGSHKTVVFSIIASHIFNLSILLLHRSRAN